MHSSHVYSKLGDAAGLRDHLAVLSQVLAKIATNLRAYGRSEQLVHLTLQLFQVGGGCLGRLLGAWRVLLWPHKGGTSAPRAATLRKPAAPHTPTPGPCQRLHE